jgi:glycosyltransferase involved in cell wall biosynthesis
LAKVSVWLRGDSNDLRPVPPWKVPLKRLQLGLLFRQCDGFFCVGEANRRLYERHAVPRGKLYKATHFVDNRRFGAQAAALRPRRAELRSKFGIPAGAFCVLFCGKLIEKKRPMDVVRAAEHLRKSLHAPPIHLLFVGDGELRDTLRRACSVVFDQASGHPELGTGPISKIPASITGFLNQTEISQAYVAADCLVLPSDYGETWGLVVNEALASHLPCIVSEACGCAENLVSPEQRFPLGNVEALANRIENAACGAATVISPPDIGETVEAVVRAYRGLPSKPAVF